MWDQAAHLTAGLHSRFSQIEESAIAWASPGRTGLGCQTPTINWASPGEAGSDCKAGRRLKRVVAVARNFPKT